jgi:3-methyl-2-oxobutanoate hydroxymethyltransferase
VLGLDSTTLVYMPEMIHHAKAVRRAVKNAFLVGDMPYDSYQADPSQAVKNAERFIKEAGCDAVKLEWFKQCPFVAESIVKAGIPVMGHVGLTPQTAESFKVQGRDAQSAEEIMRNAGILERMGCFSIVLECVPQEVAQMITAGLSIPTIGIGSGVHCDGQVLVTHDLLGLSSRQPKFAKKYVDLSPLIAEAVSKYKNDVTRQTFPDPDHSFKMDPDELSKLKD